MHGDAVSNHCDAVLSSLGRRSPGERDDVDNRHRRIDRVKPWVAYRACDANATKRHDLDRGLLQVTLVCSHHSDLQAVQRHARRLHGTDLGQGYHTRLVDREVPRQVRLPPHTQADSVSGPQDVGRWSNDAGRRDGDWLCALR
jgi:hypothetical protein